MLRDEERSSVGGASSSFQEWATQRVLVYLSYVGATFTWNHGVAVETRRSACLARGTYDDAWRHFFPIGADQAFDSFA